MGKIEEIQHLWCQHCKALQRSNNTVVECWYNPLDKEAPAFCAANEDAVKQIYQLFEQSLQGLRNERDDWKATAEAAMNPELRSVLLEEPKPTKSQERIKEIFEELKALRNYHNGFWCFSDKDFQYLEDKYTSEG